MALPNQVEKHDESISFFIIGSMLFLAFLCMVILIGIF